MRCQKANSADMSVPTSDPPASRVTRWIAYGYLASVPFEIDLVVAGRSASFWLALLLIGTVVYDFGIGPASKFRYRLDSRTLSAALLLTCYVAASYLWSVDRDATFASLMVLVLTVVTWIAVATAVSGAVPQAFQALLIGTSVMSVVALNSDVDIDGRSVLSANANDVAALMAIVSAYMLSEIINRQTPLRKKILFLGLLALHFMALLATGSRTGVLAVAASAIVLICLYMLNARFAAIAGILAIGVAIVNVAPVLGIPVPDRIAEIPDALDSGDLSSREL